MIARLITRILLASLFLFAGSVHLADPALFFPIMPPWLPFHFYSVVASGVFELLGGIGLLVPDQRIQTLAGWGVVLLLVAVFPANVYMATNHIQIHGIPSQPWMAWARLPLQPILIFATLWATGIWPKAAANKS